MGKYEKSGCNECVHATSKYDWVDNKHTLIERKCLLGNADKLIKWWEDNGHKKSKDKLDLMDCHEYNETTKTLFDITDKASEILKKLSENNN